MRFAAFPLLARPGSAQQSQRLGELAASPNADQEAVLGEDELAAVLRLSQALSGELAMARLVEKLMGVAIEHAGARKGLLFLRQDAEWHLEALATATEAGVTVQRASKPLSAADVPATLVLHVAATGRSIVLNDATAPHPFPDDRYFQEQSPRSVMCLPLCKDGVPVGVLYLEDKLAPCVFTPARHRALDLLSSQAAISLGNARMYAVLEQENAERRESEAALRRSEERYALAMEAAADGHAEWIADEDVFYASPRLLQQWGISPELTSTTRQQMLDLFPFHPDDRKRVVALLDRHRQGDARRLEFDARLLLRGGLRWMHCTILYVRDEAGRLVRSSIATTDVTDRMRAEEELRLSEERCALALAGSNEGPFDWDLRADMIYASPRTQELLGLSVGPCWRTRATWEKQIEYHPGDYERMAAALQDHLEGKTSMYEMEVRIILPDGKIRCFLQRGTVLRDASGAAYRMVGSLGDITERKGQQEELARLENRLRQAERFEAMGTLAGGIAHDFNNILGAILGFGERALRAVREGSRLHQDLGNVMVAAERGRTLVDRILSFSRGDSCKRVPVHIEQVVHEGLKLLRAKLPPHVRLRTRLQAGRAAILGDPVQVHQLLMNLVTNAAQAMTQAGTLTVSLELAEIQHPRQARVGALAAGAWIVLQVSDQGSGMTPDIMECIFDPFFTTKQAGVGTGLGLSLLLRIVTKFGGAIDVDSTPGAGSVFTVYLPHAGDAPQESPHARTTPPRGQGQRILVVEDEEPLLELTTSALQELGYEPAGFGSARAALEAFRARPDDFDLLLTDLRMPGMSGETLMREARRLRPLLPVILISGHVGTVTPGGEGNGHADEVLTKPLQGHALASSLARVLAPP